MASHLQQRQAISGHQALSALSRSQQWYALPAAWSSLRLQVLHWLSNAVRFALASRFLRCGAPLIEAAASLFHLLGVTL
jgi:hypothetical protein